MTSTPSLASQDDALSADPAAIAQQFVAAHGTLFDALVAAARAQYPQVATGRFGANMQVHLVNDGPVTIPLNMN